MSDRTVPHEDWQVIENTLRSDISRNSIIRAVAICNKYTWLCPVDKCDRIYGNKQRLDRHLGKEHPNIPEDNYFVKSDARNMTKLIAWLGMSVDSQQASPVTAGNNGTGRDSYGSYSTQLQMPVNVMDLSSGQSPHGSPGHWTTIPDTQQAQGQAQSPSNGRVAGGSFSLPLGTGDDYPSPSSSEPFHSRIYDSYDTTVSQPVDFSQAPHSQPTTTTTTAGHSTWFAPGNGSSGPRLPYEQLYPQTASAEQPSSNGWGNHPGSQGHAIPVTQITHPNNTYFHTHQLGDVEVDIIEYPTHSNHTTSSQPTRGHATRNQPTATNPVFHGQQQQQQPHHQFHRHASRSQQHRRQ